MFNFVPFNWNIFNSQMQTSLTMNPLILTDAFRTDWWLLQSKGSTVFSIATHAVYLARGPALDGFMFLRSLVVKYISNDSRPFEIDVVMILQWKHTHLCDADSTSSCS